MLLTCTAVAGAVAVGDGSSGFLYFIVGCRAATILNGNKAIGAY